MASSSASARDEAAFSVDRLAALSDGIFAVAMTLLVFNVHLPPGPLTDAQIRSALTGIVPDLLALVLSFCVAGMFWRGTHKLLRVMRNTSRPPVFATLIFLLTVVVLPISTNLYGSFGATRTVALIYSGNLAAIALLQAFLWLLTLSDRSAAAGPRLPYFAPALYTFTVFLIAALVGFVAPRVSQFIWFAAFAAPAVARLVGGRGDRSP